MKTRVVKNSALFVRRKPRQHVPLFSDARSHWPTYLSIPVAAPSRVTPRTINTRMVISGRNCSVKIYGVFRKLLVHSVIKQREVHRLNKLYFPQPRGDMSACLACRDCFYLRTTVKIFLRYRHFQKHRYFVRSSLRTSTLRV